jgi:hypothetical protein
VRPRRCGSILNFLPSAPIAAASSTLPK